MENTAKPEEQLTDVNFVQDDPFGIGDIEVLSEEPQAEEMQADEAEEALEVDDVEESEGEEIEPDEEPEQVETGGKKKRNANSRISELSQKLREKDERLQKLEEKLENLTAAKDYLNDQKPKPEVDLDAQLQEAAKMAGDDSFDLDDFTTEAEKKTALRAYNLEAQQKQQQMQNAIRSVKDQYSQTVMQYKETDANVSNALVAAYNAAVTDEARAIMRRYDNVTQQQAIDYAEKTLLTEAQSHPDPVVYIAKFGKQIIDDAQTYLPKEQESAKIDHKGREKAKESAGKPEVDTVPMTKAQMRQIEKEFSDIGF